MGAVPSVSLPPVVSCAKDIPCRSDCYVIRNMIGGPYGKSIGASYAANWELLTHDREDYHAQLDAWLSRRAPGFFRFHVSGDFVDCDHLHRSMVLASLHPETKFLAFTKNHGILPRLNIIPVNFTVIASMWPGWGKRPRGYRVAWMQDGTEDRIPTNALPCPGNCETCGMCWNLRTLKRDVWFHYH